jgi:hypothetical protein
MRIEGCARRNTVWGFRRNPREPTSLNVDSFEMEGDRTSDLDLHLVGRVSILRGGTNPTGEMLNKHTWSGVQGVAGLAVIAASQRARVLWQVLKPVSPWIPVFVALP